MATRSVVYISEEDQSRTPLTDDLTAFMWDKYPNKQMTFIESISILRSNLSLIDGIYLDRETEVVYQKLTSKHNEGNKETFETTITKLGYFQKISLVEVIQKDIKNCPKHIEFLVDQTEELCWIAIKKDPCNIRYIRNPNREMCLHALYELPYLIEYIENQTEELCSYVTSRGHIEGIKNPTPQMCIDVIKKCAMHKLGGICKYLKEKDMLTDDVLKAIINRDRLQYFNFESFSLEIQKYIIDLDYNNYFHIKEHLCPEMKDYVVKKYLAAMQKEAINHS